METEKSYIINISNNNNINRFSDINGLNLFNSILLQFKDPNIDQTLNLNPQDKKIYFH